MRRRTVFAVLVPVLVASGAVRSTRAASNEVPPGWEVRGSSPEDYEMATDTETRHGGAASAVIRSRARPGQGFGTLMQVIAANEYRGRRVQLTAMVKSKDVRGWAGVWMRIDGERDDALAFDNMQERKIRGTRDWERYAVVLDVPPDAAEIYYGLLLDGSGAVWVDDFDLEVVGPSVKATGPPPQPVARTRPLRRGLPSGLVNPAFEEGARTMPSPVR